MASISDPMRELLVRAAHGEQPDLTYAQWAWSHSRDPYAMFEFLQYIRKMDPTMLRGAMAMLFLREMSCVGDDLAERVGTAIGIPLKLATGGKVPRRMVTKAADQMQELVGDLEAQLSGSAPRTYATWTFASGVYWLITGVEQQTDDDEHLARETVNQLETICEALLEGCLGERMSPEAAEREVAQWLRTALETFMASAPPAPRMLHD